MARALESLGAFRTAERVLLRLIARGEESLYFGPAVRKLVDVTLVARSHARGIAHLESLEENGAPGISDELAYLRGRHLQQQGKLNQAAAAFDNVGERSRFYASARYLQGVIATDGGELEEAEALFCAVTERDRNNSLALFADARFDDVRDLARLGLGRVAHEQVRGDDAFYYYFQVPNDSAEVAAALFESAYSMYEADDHDTALDLLDQLAARFASTAFSDEATLLRGYIHLKRCEYEKARLQFERYRAVFGPVRGRVQTALTSTLEREQLFDSLLSDGSHSAMTDASETHDWRDFLGEAPGQHQSTLGDGGRTPRRPDLEAVAGDGPRVLPLPPTDSSP